MRLPKHLAIIIYSLMANLWQISRFGFLQNYFSKFYIFTFEKCFPKFANLNFSSQLFIFQMLNFNFSLFKYYILALARA